MIQLLRELDSERTAGRYVAEIDGDELFVAESRVETAVDSVLVLDGGLAVVEIRKGEEARNEFGVEGAIAMFGEE